MCSWGEEWHDQQIIIFTDNQAITHVWRTGTSVDRAIMKLVRFLFLFTARRNINVLLQHIPGQSNSAADSLSRLQVGQFFQLCPAANSHPSPIADKIWSILT